MMGNQKLVEKFVRKFLEDPTYKQIKESVEKMDYDEILRATHTMKGIASNLEFTQLQQKKCKGSRYDPCRRKGNCIASD